MLFKTFSRMFVLVSLCVLFAAVASKPARSSRQFIERRIADRAVTATKTLKQYDARTPHTRTHLKRQASPGVAAGARVANDQGTAAPADNQDVTTSNTNGHLIEGALDQTPTSTHLSLGVGPTGIDIPNFNPRNVGADPFAAPTHLDG